MSALDKQNRLLTTYLNKRDTINTHFIVELDLAQRNAGNLACLRMDIERLNTGRDAAMKYALQDYTAALARLEGAAQ